MSKIADPTQPTAAELAAELSALSAKAGCRLCAVPEQFRAAIEPLWKQKKTTLVAIKALLAKYGYEISEKTIARHLKGCLRG